MAEDKQIDGRLDFKYDSRWEDLLENERFNRELCNDILQPYILNQRWYGGKASALKYLEIIDSFPIEDQQDRFYGIVLEVNFQEAFVQNYFLPIAFITDQSLVGDKLIAKLRLDGQEGYLVDALLLESFRKQIFLKILEGEKYRYKEIAYRRGRSNTMTGYQSSRLMGVEQSNTSII